ncbi:MAG: hypothetical protein CMQ15_04160 [Gammaproteobacteria bacterium]|nr:hypothetical protein [Gammaproteobacteria bacterium]
MNAERPALREFTSMSIVALQQLDLAVSAWIFHQIPTVAAPGHALATESGETSWLSLHYCVLH